MGKQLQYVKGCQLPAPSTCHCLVVPSPPAGELLELPRGWLLAPHLRDRENELPEPHLRA